MMGNVVNVITKNDSSWSRTNEISHAGFNMMQGVDQTDDERYLYVSSRNADWSFKTHFEVTGEGPSGTTGIIDVQTEQVIKLIEVEEFAAGLTVGK